MGLNTYPSNPFPPSTDRMDADALEAEVSQLKSGLTNYQTQNNLNLEVPDRKNLFIGIYGANSTTVYSPVKPSTKYTISTKSTGASQINMQYIYTDDTIGGNAALCPSGATTNSITVTTPNNAKGIEIYAVADASAQSYASKTQIELGSTATAYAPYIPSVESRIEAVESGLTNVLTDISANTRLNKDSNLDTLPLGWYGINTYEGSGTGTGVPAYNTVGILWHVKGASNSFIQYIFGYNYFSCRIRANVTDAWEAWKFSHNALPT